MKLANRIMKRPEKMLFQMINLILTAWSFLIICVASYPISICNAAMVVVHDLRTCKENVTIWKCVSIATKHIGKIWTFTVIDSWITVMAILDRLPKKRGHRRTVADELLYYAWKVATIAVVPALVNGRGFVDAGKDSLNLLTSDPLRTLGLRMGYSAVCWLVGILAYLGAILLYAVFPVSLEESHGIFNFYLLMAIPIVIAVCIIAVFIRPIFLLGVAKFYTDVIDVNAEMKKDETSLPSLSDFLLSWKTIIFAFLLIEVLLALFFGDRIGFVRWIHQVAHKEVLQLQSIQ